MVSVNLHKTDLCNFHVIVATPNITAKKYFLQTNWRNTPYRLLVSLASGPAPRLKLLVEPEVMFSLNILKILYSCLKSLKKIHQQKVYLTYK